MRAVAASTQQKQRLMIIDTLEVQADNYIKALSEHYGLSHASSVNDAWELLKHTPIPDAILLDVITAGKDALAFCQRIKKNPYYHDVPIIFLSAESDPNIQSDAFSAGAADFITKPPDFSGLLARMNRHIQQHHKTKRLQSLVFIDPLTHLPNAAKFNEVLIQEWSRCARYKHKLSLILIQIDLLQAENTGPSSDEYYAIMPNIADNLATVGSRPGDFFASLNANTFGLILSDCSSEGAAFKSAQIIEKFNHPDFMGSHQALLNDIRCTIACTAAAPACGSSSQELMKTTEALLIASQQQQKGGVFQHDKLLGIEGLSSFIQ